MDMALKFILESIVRYRTGFYLSYVRGQRVSDLNFIVENIIIEVGHKISSYNFYFYASYFIAMVSLVVLCLLT